jgi:cell division topological specificity factor
MLAHERVNCKLPYLDDLRNDLIEVIKKYTSVDDVKITSQNNQNIDMLEVEIILGKK